MINPNNIKEHKTKRIELEHDAMFQLCTAAGRGSKKWSAKQMWLSDFVSILATRRETPETAAEYHRMDKAGQDEIKDVGGFFAGTLKDGRRAKSSVGWRTFVTLDADHAAENTLERIQTALGEYCYSVYSTHKHTPKEPRLRLLVYPDRPMSTEEYPAVIRMLASKVDIDVFDDTTYDLNRLMYWPSCSKDAEYIYHHNDAPLFSVDDILAQYGTPEEPEAWRNTWLWPTSSRESKNFKLRLGKQQDPATKSGIVGAFCRVFSITDALEMTGCYKHHDRNRWTYTPGSTTGGLIVYDDKFTYSHHGTDPTSGVLCNAFDLVRMHKFGDQDTQSPLDTPTGKLPSYRAMLEYCRGFENVKAQMVKDRIQDFDEVLDTDEGDKGEWIKRLQINDSGVIKGTFFNCKTIVLNDAKVKRQMGYNEFALRMEYLPERRLWETSDSSEIRAYIGENYEADFSDSNIEKAVELGAKANRYHPVRDYLNALEWDGVNRIDGLLIKYFGCKDSAYNREVIACWMIAAVARVFNPGCKWDYVPVLGGAQGIGKTTFIHTLAKGWYGELNSFDNKVAIEEISGKWIVEITELGAMNRHDLEQQKAFLSATSTTVRVAYARYALEYQRQCVFMGTTNLKSDYLKDSTGNRRWWPVDCVRTDFIDIDELSATVDQLWAEAAHRYKADGLQMLSKEARSQAESAQQDKLQFDEWDGLIAEALLQSASKRRYDSDEVRLFDEMDDADMEPRTRICVPEIWEDILGYRGKSMQPRDRQRICGIMDLMPAWTRTPKPQRFGKRFGTQRGWIAEPTREEMPF